MYDNLLIIFGKNTSYPTELKQSESFNKIELALIRKYKLIIGMNFRFDINICKVFP